MADDRADAAVVDRVVGVHVEEWRLQDRGGEHDLVHAGVVVGIHGLRRHVPLAAVDRAAELGDLAIVLDLVGAHHVADQIIGLHRQLRVVLPFVRIADLGRELGQFLQRPGLGFRAHPVEILDADLVGLHQVADQYLHPRLGLGREVLGHVEPAQHLAEGVLGGVDAALPARLELGDAVEGGAVEREVLVDEGLGQERRVVGQQIPLQPALDRGQIGAVQDRVVGLEEARLADDDPRRLADAGAVDERRPVEVRHQPGQLVEAVLVVGLVGVARVDFRPLLLGEPGFQRHDVGGQRFGVVDLGQREHLADVGLVPGPDLGELGVVLEVVVTVR